VQRIGFDGVDDGTLAPARQNPDDDPHENAACQRGDKGAWIELRRRTELFAGFEREKRLMHPLRYAANGCNCNT
jgi:hypothetical protein